MAEARARAGAGVRFLVGQRILVHEPGALLAGARPPARLARRRRRRARRPRPPRAEGRARRPPRRAGRRRSIPSSLRCSALTLDRRGRGSPERAEPRLRAAADLRSRRDAARGARRRSSRSASSSKTCTGRTTRRSRWSRSCWSWPTGGDRASCCCTAASAITRAWHLGERRPATVPAPARRAGAALARRRGEQNCWPAAPPGQTCPRRSRSCWPLARREPVLPRGGAARPRRARRAAHPSTRTGSSRSPPRS